jgi:hypothetical protein
MLARRVRCAYPPYNFTVANTRRVGKRSAPTIQALATPNKKAPRRVLFLS